MSKPLKILECFDESVGDRCASARKIAKMTSQDAGKNFSVRSLQAHGKDDVSQIIEALESMCFRRGVMKNIWKFKQLFFLLTAIINPG